MNSHNRWLCVHVLITGPASRVLAYRALQILSLVVAQVLAWVPGVKSLPTPAGVHHPSLSYCMPHF